MLVDGELQITESPVVAEYILNKFGPSTGKFWPATGVPAGTAALFAVGVVRQNILNKCGPSTGSH